MIHLLIAASVCMGMSALFVLVSLDDDRITDARRWFSPLLVRWGVIMVLTFGAVASCSASAGMA